MRGVWCTRKWHRHWKGYPPVKAGVWNNGMAAEGEISKCGCHLLAMVVMTACRMLCIDRWRFFSDKSLYIVVTIWHDVVVEVTSMRSMVIRSVMVPKSTARSLQRVVQNCLAESSARCLTCSNVAVHQPSDFISCPFIDSRSSSGAGILPQLRCALGIVATAHAHSAQALPPPCHFFWQA